jgi:hypothetical protein
MPVAPFPPRVCFRRSTTSSVPLSCVLAVMASTSAAGFSDRAMACWPPCIGF